MALSKSFAQGDILTATDVNTHLAHHVPTAGDPYDTGWLPVTAENGFTSAASVRRIGLVLYFRGTLNGSLPANTTTTIGRSPLVHSGFNRIVSTANTSGLLIDYLTFLPSGLIAARHTAARTGNISLAPLSGTAI